MDPRAFTPQSPGRLIQAEDALGLRGLAFLPDTLPPSLDWTSLELRTALSAADQELTRLDGMARQIERPELLFANYLRKEAVLSSAIEGTHTSLADLALFEVSRTSRNPDDAHVENYVKAFEYGRERVDEVRVGGVLFNELHEILMAAADERRFAPGRYRDCQVYVGQPNFESARYVPPPHMYVRELIDDLDTYLERNPEPALIKLAVAHYQFEAIHPYRDGNGRVGRLMISLWLRRSGILTAPLLYLSAFFERHRDEYTMRSSVSARRDLGNGGSSFSCAVLRRNRETHHGARRNCSRCAMRTESGSVENAYPRASRA
jgi:Fic family protein